MAKRTASIGIDIKAEGFKRGLDKMERDTKGASSKMGSAFSSSMNAGAQGALKAVGGVFSTIKSGIGMVGGLMGGIGFGALIKSSLDADKSVRRLQFTLGAGTGKFMRLEKIQGKLQQSAVRWGISMEDLNESTTAVKDTTGSTDFALGTIEAIAQAARASGQSVESLGGIVADMNRQFGITTEQVPEALATVLSLGNMGGLNVQELGASLGKLGRVAKLAGLQGSEGMAKLIGMTNQISGPAGSAEAAVEKMQAIFNVLGKRDEIKKSLRIDIKGMDAIQALQAILAKTGGSATGLKKVFGDQATIIAQAFGQRFADVAKATAGPEADKTAAALADFEENLRVASTGAQTAADVQKRAKGQMASSGAGIDKALELLKASFQTPEMMTAIESLASNLPALAEAVAKAVEFIMKNPISAGGIAMGGLALKSGLSTGLSVILSGILKGGGAAGAAAPAAAAAAAAAPASTAAAAAGIVAGGVIVAAAITTVAVAIDQAVKLFDEIDDYKRFKKQEQDVEIADALEAGAVPEQAKSLLGLGIIETGGQEYLSRGEHGNIRTRDEKFGPLGVENLGTVAIRGMLFEQGLGKYSGIGGAPQGVNMSDAFTGFIAPPEKEQEVAEAVKTSSQSGSKTIVAALSQLSVRVNNPEDFKLAAPAGGPPTLTTPTPGRVDRP